jgi:hypothetical protein
MIVSLSDEASGDFADANVRPPYKPETKAPMTSSCVGCRAKRFGMHLTIVGGGVGPTWAWLRGPGLLPVTAGVPLTGLAAYRFRYDGKLHRLPPRGLTAVLLHRASAPISGSIRNWAAGRWGEAEASLCPRSCHQSSIIGILRLLILLEMGRVVWSDRGSPNHGSTWLSKRV